ncbi:MAG: D-glycero-beta-D-manno-heptose 1-phosphate adenylyltransferase [Candidatus Omnitrophota bacterium]
MDFDKIKTQDELIRIVEEKKADGKKIGFTNGCFDVLHLGHVRYLKLAKKECDLLIVAVNSDNSVKKLGKGFDRPVNGENARTEVLAALESVDFITLFDEDTPERLIKKITPDVLLKGGDWDEDKIAGAEHVKASGGRVKLINYVPGFSTTGLINKLKLSGR